MDASVPSNHHLAPSSVNLTNSTALTSSWPCSISRSKSHNDAVDTRPSSPNSGSHKRAGALNSSPPRLRKKPRYQLIPTIDTSAEPAHVIGAHMRNLSGIKTLSIPSFRRQNETEDHPRPNSSHSTTRPTTPSLPTQPSNPNINRSPPTKRKPPASHSSYGIDTSLAPPPSYSTQRTLSQDRLWSGQTLVTRATNTSERVTPQPHEAANKSKSLQPDLPTHDSSSTNPIVYTTDTDLSTPETIDSQSVATPQDSDMTPPMSVGEPNATEYLKPAPRGLGLDGTHDEQNPASSGEDTNKSEDLFLNIAKTDASRTLQPSVTGSKRRSRISLPFLSGSRSAMGTHSSPVATQFESQHSTPQPEIPHRYTKRSSLGQHVPGALTSSQYFDDSRSTVSRLADHKPTIPSNDGRPSTRSRRYSNTNAENLLRPSTRSQTGRTSRLVSENLYSDRLRADVPATESTISTTAPSTVWDELDDLKSRIKKLELTGKLPPSSAAAMVSSERPRTATTQATTMSSSPKHKTTVPALPSAIEGIPSTTHPLLHEALTNAKTTVSNEIYQKLQATASDALQLSALTSQDNSTGMRSPMSPADERQIRRRTESMCRSLTELAIALLAESKTAPSPMTRPGSREAGTAFASRTRRASNEPSDRPPVTTRVHSRLESRRTSLMMDQPSASSPVEQTDFGTPAPSVISQPATTSRIVSRTSTVRHRRTPGYHDGANDDDESVLVRPVSRAMTDVASSHRPSARNRANFSREYTKQHPLPTQQIDTSTLTAKTAPLPSNLVTRRTYPSPASTFAVSGGMDTSSPITPSQRGPSSFHVPIQRPPFTISIERRNPHVARSTVSQETPESNSGSIPRQSSSRRSLGFASRISNVSSRLKAARAERLASSSASRSPPKDIVDIAGDGQENASYLESVMQTRVAAEDAGVVGEDS